MRMICKFQLSIFANLKLLGGMDSCSVHMTSGVHSMALSKPNSLIDVAMSGYEVVGLQLGLCAFLPRKVPSVGLPASLLASAPGGRATKLSNAYYLNLNR